MSATTPEACCTCATLLSARPPAYTYDEKHPYDEKRPDQPPTMTPSRRLPCCRRAICAPCTTANPRFATYCPFCQVSTGPSALPATGLRLPPAYSPPSSLVRARGSRRHVNEGHRFDEDEQPPAYTPRPGAVATPQLDEKASSFADDEPAAPDVLHFLDPERDSVQSLALRYGVPAAALRRANGLFADHLLAARRTALIPGEYYKGGVSLSPRPVDGEEEERRKGCVRRFMVGCKVAEYDVAVLYLKQHDYDLNAAIEAYKADERWEKENPLQSSSKNNGRNERPRRRFGVGGSLAGQLF